MNSIPSYRNIWNISYPIILSLLAQNIITVIDTAFLGRVGEVELGASAIGGLFYFSFFMLGFGFGNGAQILMARRNGEKNFPMVGKIFDHTLYIFAIMSALLILFTFLISNQLLKWFISSEAIYHASVTYFNIRVLGMFFSFANVAFRAYLVGITKTKLLSYGAAIMAVVNVALDYLLIFGHYGFPEMGIAGAAIASLISEATAIAFYTIAILVKHENRKYELFKFPRFNKEIVATTWSISIYIMIQNFISMVSWFLFFLFIEHLGERSLAISNIIRSIYMTLMIHVWAFSSSVNSLVSNSIGSGLHDMVLPIIRKVNRLSILITLLVIFITVTIPGLLIRIYTDDITLINEAIPVLFVVVGAVLPVALANNWFSGVSGTAKTNVALVIEIFCIIFYLTYVWLVIFKFDVSLPVEWISEYVYIFLLGAISYLYLKFGKWQTKII